jgi:hypothetical protein
VKKIFLLIASVALITIGASAQSATFSQTASNPTGAYSNTGLDTVTVTLTNYFKTVSIQPVATKVSGTMAGTAVLYASVDGTNFVATGDTLTCTNVAVNTAIWSKTDPAILKYRIIFTGSGTMAATAAAKLFGRKP